MWRTWERWRLSFPYKSIASSSWCPQTEESCYQNTFTTSSDGQGYDSSNAKSHLNRIMWSLSIYPTTPSPNATQTSPSPASYSLTAYPSEPSLCVLTIPSSFQQSVNQFSNSNNSWQVLITIISTLSD